MSDEEWKTLQADRLLAADAWVKALPATDPTPILVWAFGDAPEALRELSGHGGDEDRLAYVPPGIADDYIGWMREGTSFGCCRVSEHPLPCGGLVTIGAHA